MDNLDKIAKEHLSSKICGKCSMYEECAKGQVACVDIEIFKAGYKACMEEWRKCFLSCSSPYCADKFPTVEINGIMGNMDKVDNKSKN